MFMILPVSGFLRPYVLNIFFFFGARYKLLTVGMYLWNNTASKSLYSVKGDLFWLWSMYHMILRSEFSLDKRNCFGG